MGGRPLEAHTEKQLLRILGEEKNSDASDTFKSVCNNLLDDDGNPIFGNPVTSLHAHCFV